MDQIRRDELAIELSGEGVTPATVDATSLLSVAHAYIDLVTALARASGKSLSFVGVRVVDKCAAIATPPSDKAIARETAQQVEGILSGARPAPKGAEGKAKTLARSIEQLPSGHAVSIVIGRRKWPLLLPTIAPPPPPRPWSRSSVRVRVVDLQPRAYRTRFSCSWLADFSLSVTEEQIKEIGKHVCEELDIDVRWTFDVDNQVEAGEVVAVHPIPAGNALEAWQRWYSGMTDGGATGEHRSD